MGLAIWYQPSSPISATQPGSSPGPTRLRRADHVSSAAASGPAHVRSILTQSDLNIPVIDGRCALGTWQGIYLWEHRRRGHRRRVIVTVTGE